MSVIESVESAPRFEASSRTLSPPTAAPGHPAPFPAEDIAAFRAQDTQAARAVVGIMMAIFAAAIVGYTFICYVALTN
ncbi:hypothetical protein AYO44_04605 [Planctomycetaceae bacterium SCGC AG-212-F19]|nr:hypothetical protein AYO44_04605 [Planctomycetaceae bacterium SCGC AG-212-F19]